MHNSIFVASAALGALALAFVARRERGTSRPPERDVVRRAATFAVCGPIVALLLGWAASAVAVGPPALVPFLILAALLCFGLVFAARSGSLE